MKIAITAANTDLQSPIDPRFGRALYFILVDPQTLTFETLENSGVAAAHGAGIQAAQLLSSHGVTTLITGQVGPNAFQTLTAAGIQIFQTLSGTVAQAIEAFKAGQLPAITQAGPAHAGMGGGGQHGQGMGRGLGRGQR
ncbi:NifB/NifX family molybdenum-iron cluster-binding protein [candidate division KSB1 bacterium]|nr:NifB/NifX family molybdenum-iron cluster-binding protein [candidate division KSB1 bacterium]